LEVNPAFREQYARARELQAHYYFEKIAQIAFDESKDFFVDNETGKVVSDHVRVARARVQIDALKWASAKLLPKVYGDRGDRPDEDEKPKRLNIAWIAPERPVEPPPAPPKQLEYRRPELPGDLSERDWSVMLQTLEVIKRTIPSNSDSPPAEVFEIIRTALLTHFEDKPAPKKTILPKRGRKPAPS